MSSTSKRFQLLLILYICTHIFGMNLLHAETDWLLGKWELVYDPDDAQKDWIVFLPDGDVISDGPNGKVEGIYIVTGDDENDGVKAVFTYRQKDFIMNFVYDKQEKALKIVTSHTGKASVYKRLRQGKK